MAADTIAPRPPRRRGRKICIAVAEADPDPYDVLVIPKTDDATDAQADDLQAVFRVFLILYRRLSHGKITVYIQDGVIQRLTREESIVIQ